MTGHEHLDARLRAAHAMALDHLSPKTQAQLAQRQRRALAAQDVPHARPVVRWAVATLAVCAIAIGLFLPQRAPSPSTPPLASTTPRAVAADTTIDDNPDFYLWLASSDATSLASE